MFIFPCLILAMCKSLRSNIGNYVYWCVMFSFWHGRLGPCMSKTDVMLLGPRMLPTSHPMTEWKDQESGAMLRVSGKL
jgi:hypothetical protein